MSTVRNASRSPLRVPLPGGKTLFLAPGQEGQIGPRAQDHPPIAALIEAGKLEHWDGKAGSGERGSKAGEATKSGGGSYGVTKTRGRGDR